MFLVQWEKYLGYKIRSYYQHIMKIKEIIDIIPNYIENIYMVYFVNYELYNIFDSIFAW